MRFDFERELKALDDTMVELFQRWTNKWEMSNFFWVTVLCALGGISTLRIFMGMIVGGVENPLLTTWLAFLIMCYTLAGLWARRMDTHATPETANPLQAYGWFVICRVVSMILLWGVFGEYVFGFFHHWRAVNMATFLSTYACTPVALYFATCTPPPPKRKQVRVNSNNHRR
jgi:MFS family permease